jgi:hypothetical protein
VSGVRHVDDSTAACDADGDNEKPYERRGSQPGFSLLTPRTVTCRPLARFPNGNTFVPASASHRDGRIPSRQLRKIAASMSGE